MPLWMVSIALATEPIVIGESDPDAPSLQRTEVVLSWSDVGLRPAAPVLAQFDGDEENKKNQI